MNFYTHFYVNHQYNWPACSREIGLTPERVGYALSLEQKGSVNHALLLEREICKITDTPFRQPELTRERIIKMLPECGIYTGNISYLHMGSVVHKLTRGGFTFQPVDSWIKIMTDPKDGRVIVVMNRVFDSEFSGRYQKLMDLVFTSLLGLIHESHSIFFPKLNCILFDHEAYNIHLTGLARQLVTLSVASDFLSLAYLFNQLRHAVAQLEELVNTHQLYVCDMNADIYFTPADTDLKPLSPVMEDRKNRPRLLSLGTKPMILVCGRDLRHNPFFDP